MNAMVLDRSADVATGPLHLRDVPVPRPASGEVLVKVRVCGVCRTDLHVVEGELPDIRLPLIPGHQVVGTVAELGAGVSELREGDRVGIAWLQATCGACEFCTSGRENLCEKARFTRSRYLRCSGGSAVSSVRTRSSSGARWLPSGVRGTATPAFEEKVAVSFSTFIAVS